MQLQIIDSLTERTTAVTDAALAVLAGAAAIHMLQLESLYPWKAYLWAWIFGLLAVAALLGTLAHGFSLSASTQTRLWHPLYLSLGLLIALIMVAAIYDFWGLDFARWILPIMIAIGLLFFVITLFWPDSFLVFILYEAVAMLLALVAYLWLAVGGHLDGAWLMVTGILVTIMAAGIQAGESITFTVIWPFDHNGAYHLIQMVGVVLLVAGLRFGLLSI